MTVLTTALSVPRTVLALEYRALRYPAQLLETRVVATRLAEDSPVRLSYERVLGALDRTAGSLLADEALADRGRLLTRRADVLQKAVALEEKAEQRKQQADAALEEQTAQAQQAKADAARTRQERTTRAKAGAAKAKADATRKADQREEQAKEAVADATATRLRAERERADAQRKAIEERTEAASAAPRAQLSEAVAQTGEALEKRSEAEVLASLADAEKASRRS